MDRPVKTVAYLRVSTPHQDVRHDFRIDDFIEATASGQASEKRRRLDELRASSAAATAWSSASSRGSAGRWVRS